VLCIVTLIEEHISKSSASTKRYSFFLDGFFLYEIISYLMVTVDKIPQTKRQF